MKLQQWMMKDPDLPQPQRTSQKEEHGWYLFFDVINWRRERVCLACQTVEFQLTLMQRDFTLNYDDLDQRHGPASAPAQ